MLEFKGFRRFLNQKCGVEHGKSILVGFSGGADSVALLHLLTKCNNKVFAAHCNFNLRGDESNEDEKFVEQMCNEWGIELFVNNFDTREYAEIHGLSIEMAARFLRYNWFDELCRENAINYVALGHHKNDQVETFFINLTRGTGIKGLTGMNSRTNNLVRPLLEVSKDEILDYCRQNSLEFRFDSSNNDIHIIRNRIRHEIIPLFETINPSFVDTMFSNMKLLEQANRFLVNEIEKKRDSLVVETNGVSLISIKELVDMDCREIVLFELLNDKGFNSTQIKDICKAVDSESGRQFFSVSHRLVRDRYNLIIMPLMDNEENEFYINADDIEIEKPLSLRVRVFEKDASFEFSKDLNCIHIDFGQIEFPMTLRRWKRGDSFRPLGMTKFKKVSDFFIDQKLSIVEKENVWILISNDEIVSILRYRIDDRFKITHKTEKIFELKLI
ncbi:MAG: tRNA lysidine(34) synthetase TilS [Marinilabiliaceae bacterium]|nr:tRNA lysidine(34) synthetase TilS [Marinilabiliaceae bacterium]